MLEAACLIQVQLGPLGVTGTSWPHGLPLKAVEAVAPSWSALGLSLILLLLVHLTVGFEDKDHRGIGSITF